MTVSTVPVTLAIFAMSNDELDEVIQAVKHRRTQLAMQVTRKLRVGATVEFTGKRGETIRGTITKVNPKTCLVKQSNAPTVWRVTASLLTEVTESV